MAIQNHESKHYEFPDDRPTGDDIFDGLLMAADRALAQGDRVAAVILINEIFRVIDRTP